LFFGWLLESKYIMFWYTFCCRYSPRPRFALVFWKIMIMFLVIYWFWTHCFWFLMSSPESVFVLFDKSVRVFLGLAFDRI
jgi:hypothetical protein